MNKDLKVIKKHYGENMMHLCRELFPTLLETEGLLCKLMLDSFNPSRFLYDDIINNDMKNCFKNFIYGLNEKSQKIEEKCIKEPKKLLLEVGYELYECKTEEDIQKFKKYYAPKEELCTFKGGRLNSCYVFFAVKKNVTSIRRENFRNPKREDEYGTSVISIQFTKGNVNTLSIKNRYNHNVINPDATFSNNLENIISGLTQSFEDFYGLNINQSDKSGFELPNYVKASDGKYYKYNYEINNIYYCPNNIIIDKFEVKKYDKEKYIILDYFVLDLVNKKIELYDKTDFLKDSFVESIKDIEKIIITKDKKTGNKEIEINIKNQEKIIIVLDNFNRIITYKNNYLKRIDNGFLVNNETLSNLELLNLEEVGNLFLFSNDSIEYLNLPNLEYVGDDFLYCNDKITNLNLPKLKKVRDYFMCCNNSLKKICLPELQYVGDRFLAGNCDLSYLELPKLEEVGLGFLYDNFKLENLYLPNLRKIDHDFLYQNTDLNNINLPSLEYVNSNFLCRNEKLISLDLPKLIGTGDNFLSMNTILEHLNLPKLEFLGHSFLIRNVSLTHLELPKLTKLNYYFLHRNNCLLTANLPNLLDEEKQDLLTRFPNIELNCNNKVRKIFKYFKK